MISDNDGGPNRLQCTQLYTDGQGYIYRKTKTTDNRAYLSCYSTTCKCRAVIEDNGYRLLSVHDEHEKPRDIIKTKKNIFEDAQRLELEAANLVSYPDVTNLYCTH